MDYNNVMNYNMEMVRGDTLSFGMELVDLDQDLDSAFFSVKKNYADTDYVFQKSLNDGITKSGDNAYIIRIAPEDTADIDVRDYYYELRIVCNSDVFTILRGVLMLASDITREVQ